MTRCFYCNRMPEEIDEWISQSTRYGITRTDYVQEHDRTYDREIDAYACKHCWEELCSPNIHEPNNWRAGRPLDERLQWTTVSM